MIATLTRIAVVILAVALSTVQNCGGNPPPTVKAASPAFSPAQGSLNCPERVSIVSQSGEKVYVSVDDTAPDLNATPVGPYITIDSDTFAQAVATQPGFLTSAVTDATYQCSGTYTKADFAVDLVRALRLPPPAEIVDYADVHPGDSYYRAVESLSPYLRRQTLCPGCSLTRNFSPLRPIMRGQAAVVLASLVAFHGQSLSSARYAMRAATISADYGQLPIFARPYIALALSDDLVRLLPDHRFGLLAPFTRDDFNAAVKTLMMMLESRAPQPLHVTAPGGGR